MKCAGNTVYTTLRQFLFNIYPNPSMHNMLVSIVRWNLENYLDPDNVIAKQIVELRAVIWSQAINTTYQI